MGNAKRKKLEYDIHHNKKENVPRTRQELFDHDRDWLESLKRTDPEAYAWHNKFMNEWANASIKKVGTKKRADGTRVYGSGTPEKGSIHNTNELAKKAYDDNNARNSDIYTVSKANNLLNDVVSETDRNDGWYITNPDLTENYIIDSMEKKESEYLTKEEFLELKDNLTPDMLVFYLAMYDID